MNVLDGALLAMRAQRVHGRITSNEVLLAVADERVLGVLVTRSAGNSPHELGERTASEGDAFVSPGTRIEAIAVRRARRGQGIGTALVAATDARTDGPLSATFDAAVRPFYESLGFEIQSVGDDRCYGRLVGSNDDRDDR